MENVVVNVDRAADVEKMLVLVYVFPLSPPPKESENVPKSTRTAVQTSNIGSQCLVTTRVKDYQSQSLDERNSKHS